MPSEVTPEAETGPGEGGGEGRGQGARVCRTKVGSVFVPGVSPNFLKSHMPGFSALLLTCAWPRVNSAPFPTSVSSAVKRG